MKPVLPTNRLRGAIRLVARQERAAAILARLDDWLRHHRARASAKSPLGEALAYIAKYREGLGRFLIDGHDAGAENWAVIASLIETYKMNSIDPHAWMAATLKTIVSGHKQSQIDDLMP